MNVKVSFVRRPRTQARELESFTGGAAGNGSLMRAVTGAVCHARVDRARSWQAARQISALTHGDPAAGEGCGIYHHLVAAALGRRSMRCSCDC